MEGGEGNLRLREDCVVGKEDRVYGGFGGARLHFGIGEC